MRRSSPARRSTPPRCVPPCISMMRLEMASPSPVPPFLLGDRIVGLLELLEQLGLVGRRNARAGVAHRNVERAVGGGDLDRHFAGIGELDRVADQIEQNLRQAALVAAARRQVGRHIDLEGELLLRRQRLDRAVDVLDDILERVVGERKRELAGLDLGQIEHVVDQAEQVLAVALDPLEHRLHLLRRARRRCRRGSARCSRGWR